MKYHTLFFPKIWKDVAKFVVCCSRDWRFKGCIGRISVNINFLFFAGERSPFPTYRQHQPVVSGNGGGWTAICKLVNIVEAAKLPVCQGDGIYCLSVSVSVHAILV